MFIKYLKLVVKTAFVLVLFVQMSSPMNYRLLDNYVQNLDLANIPGPYRFESVCLNGKSELWSVGGGGEVHYDNIETGKGAVHKFENKSIFNGGFYGVFCSDDGNGLVVGDNGVIFRTSDNGKNWKLQKSNLQEDIDLQAVTCIDNNCWIAGADGTFLTSNDKGGKWNKINLKAEESLKDVFFINKQTGWVVGGEGGIWKTTDGGKNWSFQELKVDGEYAHSLSIKFHDEYKGWLSGFDFVARTEDGGTTWQTAELDGQIIGIVTQDGEKLWAIKRGGNYCSTDSGKSWAECKQEKRKSYGERDRYWK